MAAHALKSRTIRSKAKVSRKSGKQRHPRSGFVVTGRTEIEQKREEIRLRMNPDQRLYGARGYHRIAKELQFIVSNDQDSSLTEIARESGMTMATLKRLWSGRTKRPSFETVEKVYAHYGLDLGSARRLTVVKD